MSVKMPSIVSPEESVSLYVTGLFVFETRYIKNIHQCSFGSMTFQNVFFCLDILTACPTFSVFSSLRGVENSF